MKLLIIYMAPLILQTAQNRLTDWGLRSGQVSSVQPGETSCLGEPLAVSINIINSSV